MSIDDFLNEISAVLSAGSGRVIFGVVGKPGAGKSTLAEEVTKRFKAEDVAVLPMDGYHLSNEKLIELGRRDRKGAPDTFDTLGFSELLKKIKESEAEIRFPIFHREIEASVPNEGKISSSVKVIVTEGNYLLSDEFGWETVRQYLEKSFYIEINEATRLERLISRHMKYGKSAEEARAWSLGSDESNARYIEKTSHLADLTINLAAKN